MILKDVAERLGIRDIALLGRLVAYLSSTSGNLFSTRMTVGVLRSGQEVDFVASRLDERLYVQVTETMVDPQTRERELAPLRALHDAFPKMVLTLDRFSTGVTEEGIRVANIIDWLTDVA